ncbi:MAG: DUF2516 family protein [Actinomycetes bacterium]
MPPLIATLVSGLNLVIAFSALFCFIDAAIRPSQAFPAIDRQTKVFWLIILGLCFLVIGVGFGVLGLFGLFAAVAVLMYLVDVRPKIREITGKR